MQATAGSSAGPAANVGSPAPSSVAGPTSAAAAGGGPASSAGEAGKGNSF